MKYENEKFKCQCYACTHNQPKERAWIVKFRAPHGDTCTLELIAANLAYAMQEANSMLDTRCTLFSISQKNC